jgi:hypothetical protein
MSEVKQGQAGGLQKPGGKPKGRKPGVQARPAPVTTKFTGECADLIDCIFDCRDSKQSGKFKTTIGKLSTYVGSKYDYGGDVTKVIKTLTLITLTPPADPPTGSTAGVTKLWEIELTNFVKRRLKLEDNLHRLYALIWGQCTEHMKDKLEAMPNFEKMDVDQDSVALLKAIKGMTYKFADQKYLPFALADAVVRLDRMFQSKDMTDSEYLEKFKSMVAVIEHYGGTVGVHPKMVQNELATITGSPYSDNTTYSPAQIAEAKLDGKERYLACLFLMGSDKTRYGDMFTELHNDHAKGIVDAYPKTVANAYSLMDTWTAKYTPPPPLAHVQGSSFAQGGNDVITCWGCGAEGVVLAKCTTTACMEKWKAKQNRQSAPPAAPAPKVGADGRQLLNMEETGETTFDIDADDDGFDISQYMGYAFAQVNDGKVGKNLILLDNQSTHDTFYNAELLVNIKDAAGRISIQGSGGVLEYKKTGVLPGYGTVWYNPDAIANILSFSRVEKKGHKIEYADGSFKVINKNTNNQSVFVQQPGGLFAHNTTNGVSFVQTVDGNKLMFSKKQISQAKAARELYAMIGRPSIGDFMGIIKNNLLPHAKITANDIQNAELIYGKDIGAIQGKTTRNQPSPVVTDYVNVPEDIMFVHKRITLAADIMYVNKIPFMLTVSRVVQFTTIEKLNNKQDSTLVLAITKVCRLYERRGFEIHICMMDNEFESIRGSLLLNKIALNTCAPGEHVPEIERKIRTVKERIQGVVHTLPFHRLPNLLIVHVALFSVMWMNFFPPGAGASPTVSPQAIVTGFSADYEVHCKMPFGGYAQVHAEPDPTNNAMESRTVGGISLGPTGNIQGSYHFLSLLTGRRIKARSFTPLPMPAEVVKKVQDMATREDEELEFLDRNKQAYPGDWMVNDDNEEEYHDANQYLEEADPQDVPLRYDDDIEADEIVNNEPVDAGVPELADNEDDDSSDPGVPDQDNEDSLDEDDAGATPGVRDPRQYELGQGLGFGTVEEEIIFRDALESSESSIEPNDETEYESEEMLELGDEEYESEEENSDDDDRAHHTTTRRGRKVKLDKFTYDNFQLIGAIIDGELHIGAVDAIAPDEFTPSVQAAYGIYPEDAHRKCYADEEIISLAFTQYSLKQGLKKFPVAAAEATVKEMKQLHDKQVFDPRHPWELTSKEKKEALGSLIFIKEKRDAKIKARACADGRPQRLLYDKSDASSPTVKTESVLLTAVQDAAEERKIAVTDIPGAFLNAKLDEVVHMKLVGALADLLIEAAPDVYRPYAHKDGRGQTLLYVLLTRALYGCMKAALQFWKHLSGNLIKLGYVLNPYDTCVANKTIDGAQCTITWHVDDLKISHMDDGIVRSEIKGLEDIYGPMVTTYGDYHTYLGMDLDMSVPGEVSVSMIPYLQEITDEFPEEYPKGAKTPAAAHLFTESDDPILLAEPKAKVYHHTVAKILWAGLRARPDLLTALSYLTSKVQYPDEDDWKKLLRLLSYIEATIDLKLILSADGTNIVKWWTDASFATRNDMKSQTGATMSMGYGAVYSMARKQKLNTKSSTEAELVAADDILPQVVWTRNFMLSQGWEVKKNILYQDNQSAMLLEKNGVASSSKRTRHINIRFYFIKDRIDSGELNVEYCPTDLMVGDFFTKPLQGHKFFAFRKFIMGESDEPKAKECVGMAYGMADVRERFTPGPVPVGV